MRKQLAILLSTLLMSMVVFAQKAKISGKVFNSKNEALVGVTIKISGFGSGASVTSTDGRYVISVVGGKKYTLSFSYVGYTEKTIENVEVKAGGEEVIDIVLEEDKKTNTSVIVKSTAKTGAKGETVNAMIAYQKNTNTVASVISAESIRRSPDKTTSEVLKRTPGASVQEGRFLVVRGLADRYNQTMLNGILLTSTEPDRKTFSFDIIPAAMIDNIIINKAFVPELPGEWAGGLIQVNTKDIPTKNYFNVQLGTGFNTQTVGRKFYKDNAGGLDWLGFDDGARALPNSYKTKSQFDNLSNAEKTAIGKQLRNAWVPTETMAPINTSVQMSGGFTGKFLNKKVGGSLSVIYNRSNRVLEIENIQNTLAGNVFSVNYNYADTRYIQETFLGALGSFSMELNPKNKLSVKTILNVNTPSSITKRSGVNISRGDDIIGTELTFKQNTFYTTQLTGEHTISKPLKLKWYGAFNILDGYVPDQRRIQYTKTLGSNNLYLLLVSNSLSQESGSRIYQSLNDYIYTTGGDLNFNFDLFGQKQSAKAGYMFQVKDRLYDAKLFANYLPRDNNALRLLPADQVFAPANFGDGSDNSTLFAFDAIKGNNFRYLANTILNAGFLQFDNQFTNALRVVWGVRVENYDQLVGSIYADDPRHTNSVVTDILPGLNATYKLNNKTNLRFSASQTVIRPELRELSYLNIYDFELNASVQGNPSLQRTKITNIDARYEFYPKSGEVLTVGAFYKFFDKPIEQIFNEGSGGASTFNYQNPEEAKAYGVELEFRKKLDFVGSLKNFTLQANGAYIHSRVKDRSFNINRSLQGQSPYLINLGLLYDLPKHGFNATLLFNYIGERIYLVGDISAGSGSPDIYEAPRPLLDLQFSKKVLKEKAEIRLNITDIINQRQYFYQNADSKTSFQKGIDASRFTRRFGTGFNFTINYAL